MADEMDAKDWGKIVVSAMGYEDLHGKMRAATLMQSAQKQFWKEAAREVKNEYKQEIEAAFLTMKGPWNPTITPASDACRDQVRKVLQSHEIYPYPDLVAAILGDNPYHEHWTIPDYVGEKGKTTDLR